MALPRGTATRADLRAARLAARSDPNVLHFLHIGKCAGTQIGRIIAQIQKAEGAVTVVKHKHDCALRDLPPTARYFFSIREPVSRFRSAFYSRKRKGQPRIYSEWTASERAAFTRFGEANDLAEALSDGSANGAAARLAMASIRHVAQNQGDWFAGSGAFLSTRPPVFIIRQEQFSEDLNRFLSRAGYGHHSARLKLTSDPVKSHANDYAGTPALSQKAKANLRNWYANDIQFYRMCETWQNSLCPQRYPTDPPAVINSLERPFDD